MNGLTRGNLLCRTAVKKGLFLAFFPVVASNTNLSTSIRMQKYETIEDGELKNKKFTCKSLNLIFSLPGKKLIFAS